MTSEIAQKKRLDKILVDQRLVRSRERAHRLIESGKVRVNGDLITKPGAQFNNQAKIELAEEDFPWVSRAGLKLEAAINKWEISVFGRTCIDIGASTGGFTDVLLTHGARQVFAVDVGHDQLVPELKKDSRVINMEGTNIKDLRSEDIDQPIDIAVVDVSFISLKHVMPVVKKFLSPGGALITLIKPQFEVGKGHISKGVVHDPAKHAQVLVETSQMITKLGFHEIEVVPSPIRGTSGNKEFLALYKI